ncbi:EAL domain-containing protein [Acidihalobacter prosperus]
MSLKIRKKLQNFRNIYRSRKNSPSISDKLSLGLRGRLLALVVLTLAPAFVVTWYSGLQIQEKTLLSSEQHAGELINTIQNRVNNRLASTLSQLSLLASTHEVDLALNGNCSKLETLSSLLQSRTRSITVLNARGQVICAPGNSLSTGNEQSRAFFRRAVLNQHFALGDLMRGNTSAQAAITVAQPIWGQTHNLKGIITSVLHFDWLHTSVNKHAGKMDTLSYILECRHSKVIEKYPVSAFKTRTGRPQLSCSDQHHNRNSPQTRIAGQNWIIASAPIGNYSGTPNLRVAAAFPAQPLIDSEHRITRHTYILLSIIALIGLLIAWFAGDLLLLRPVRSLIAAVEAIEKGRFSTRARMRSGLGEIQRLGHALDRMTKTLEDRQAQIETQMKQIRGLNRIQQVLSAINSAMIRINDKNKLLQETCSIVVEKGGFAFAYVAFVEPPSKTVQIVANAGDASDFVTRLYLSVDPDEPEGRGLIGTSIRENRYVICNTAQSTPYLAPWRQNFIELGVKSAAAFPLRINNVPTGTIGFYTYEPDFFNEQEIKLLEELATDVAFGLEQIEKDTRIYQLAYRDTLTELANRNLFEQHLSKSQLRVNETGNQLVVIVLGISEYTLLNDISGHFMADELIKIVAHRLSSTIGTYGSEEHQPIFLGRITHEEFAIAIEDDQSMNKVSGLMTQIHHVLSKPAQLGAKDYDILYRLGAARYPTHCGDILDLLHKAQFALHTQKTTQNSGNLNFYIPEKDHEARDRHDLALALRRALEKDEFYLVYQPRIHALTRKPLGVEALLRWDRPGYGLIPPDRFIPELEETGLIVQVGEWVVNTALAQFRAWQSIIPEGFVISINASAYELSNQNYAQILRHHIERHRLKASQIEIELTETGLILNGSSTVELLKELKAIGVRLSVDDFGTGYSSLSYLHQFPLDTLKIDKRFVQNMVTNAGALPIVQSIISLANALGINAVAEGVENQEQLDLLIKEGCHEIQGYYFATPQAPEMIEKLLSENNQ